MKNLVIGILAHVDAGKTTLSEGLLFLSGKITKLGRVDKQDAYLDNFELERARGITIFSKQAIFDIADTRITLLDTPGHVDFSAEMERTLQVLDYAVLVISGADGVQGHTRTLWRLFEKVQLPVFIFVNKMDQIGTDKEKLVHELKIRLGDGCIAFDDGHTEAFYDALAMCDEATMDAYLETGQVETPLIQKAVKERKVFPCFFGSALKLEGIEPFMQGIATYALPPNYPESFGAKVFKITRDDQGNRLTHMKLTGGKLKVRDLLTNQGQHEQKEEKDQRALKEQNDQKSLNGQREQNDQKYQNGQKAQNDQRLQNGQRGQNDQMYQNVREKKEHKEPKLQNGQRDLVEDIHKNPIWAEKVTQIRVYSGVKYDAMGSVAAGTVCAVTGLSKTRAGEGLGIEPSSAAPLLEPVLSYQIILPEDCDARAFLPKLRLMAEEEPELHIVWDEALQEIHVQMMGEVQIEVLQNRIQSRFGVAVAFDAGNIVYKETITNVVEGVGHFEPLRHYAEVHLLLEPGDAGSGLIFATDCSEEVLGKSWQRLVLTHLAERTHKGVLTGVPVTDMKITLVSGKSHNKHTQGGDFREATYRAVRQGLKEAESVLLEPYYAFTLEVPDKMVGRAINDIENMHGTCILSHVHGEIAFLTGSAPVVTMKNYQKQVTAYTKGLGRLFYSIQGYAPCHNASEIIERSGYDADKDPINPSGSVFCAHGTSFSVDWGEVKDYMHLDSFLQKEGEPRREKKKIQAVPSMDHSISLEEIDRILTQTHYANRGKRTVWKKRIMAVEKRFEPVAYVNRHKETDEEYLLVDGYNIIHAWPVLEVLVETNMDSARTKLLDILSNYRGIRKGHIIVVFDAYRVQGHREEVTDYANIHVVYTREAQTADQYIERFAHVNRDKYHITVATSDGMQQMIVRGAGSALLSARELAAEIDAANEKMQQENLKRQGIDKHPLGDVLSPEARQHMAEMAQTEDANGANIEKSNIPKK